MGQQAHTWVYAGARSPETMLIAVTQGSACGPNPPYDLMAVTAVTFQVLEPGGFESTWAGDIAVVPAPTKAALTVTHTFLTGDVDVAGVYVLVPMLVVPSGVVRADPVELEVRPRFGRRTPPQEKSCP